MEGGALAGMMARHARDGRIAWIGLRPERRAAVVAVARAEVGPEGLAGDHGRPGKRAVTLVQWEHLAAIGAMLGQGPVPAEALRRNIAVAGINLAALKGAEVAVGGAVLRLVGPCHPCSRMEEALGFGGYSAVRGHGGWCAEVVRPGPVALGDAVSPVRG